MNWVVVTEASYDAWVANTDPQRDQDLRIAVLAWVSALVDGPPPEGILDPFSGYWYAEVADTGVWIKYIVLPDLFEPAIAIREYLLGCRPEATPVGLRVARLATMSR